MCVGYPPVVVRMVVRVGPGVSKMWYCVLLRSGFAGFGLSWGSLGGVCSRGAFVVC